MGLNSIPINVAPAIPGPAVIATGSVDATGAQVLAADPYRRWGVFIQNVDTVAVDSLKVGTVTGDAVFLLASAGNAVNTINSMFMPGTGSVFLKSSNGTLTTDYVVMSL